MALTSFLTGVTEPIEFTFMFLAPLLYAIHAVLTGIAMVLMHALGVHLGFGFSAGLFDYVLNYLAGDRPLLLLPVGLGVLRAVLRPVPLFHRALRPEDAGPRDRDEAAAGSRRCRRRGACLRWIDALGGAANLRAVEACTTRLRLVVADPRRIDERGAEGAGLARRAATRRTAPCRWWSAPSPTSWHRRFAPG